MVNAKCIISAIFLGASLYTILTCKNSQTFLDYENSLDLEQKNMYNKIVAERRGLYFKGLIIGSILAMLYLIYVKKTDNPLTHSCAFVAIAMFVQYMVYTLSPKSDYMIRHMKNGDQVDKWLEVYKTMKNRYHMGMLLGLVGYFLFSFGILGGKPNDILKGDCFRLIK